MKRGRKHHEIPTASVATKLFLKGGERTAKFMSHNCLKSLNTIIRAIDEKLELYFKTSTGREMRVASSSGRSGLQQWQFSKNICVSVCLLIYLNSNGVRGGIQE